LAVADERYRADELAAEAGISVQALRAYQSKGLLPPPRHEGRVAWYGAMHRDRLDRIRQLKGRGYSLRMIGEALEGGTPHNGAAAPVDDHAVLRLADVAERSGVPVEVLRALEASGLLRPHEVGGVNRFSEADVRFVGHVLALLGAGLSLEDFMRIARPLIDATDALGRDAVDAWAALVGSRLRHAGIHVSAATAGADDDDAPAGRSSEAQAARVAESLRALATIVGQLVAYRVERSILDAARLDLEAHGTDEERKAFAGALTDTRPPTPA
jgi:DNA-binding transcriptional MerR regulator